MHSSFLPLGATEQHGPHLPSGTDTFAVESIARDAAALAAEQISVVVTPSLPFGSSAHHLIFGATLSLSTETYYKALCDLLESLVQDGFTRIFLINGHGGNHELAQLAARDMALKHPVRIGAGFVLDDRLGRVDGRQCTRRPPAAGTRRAISKPQ